MSLADIVPTVLELLGRPLPTSLQGKSLVPLLGDVAPPISAAAGRVVFSERLQGTTYPVVAHGLNWRVEFSPGREPEAFFVLGSRHLRLAFAGRIISNAKLWRERFDAECRHLAPLVAVGLPAPPPRAPTAEELRALRALGYVQ